MFTLGELLSRADICSRLKIAWSERAVVSAPDHSLAIIINEKDPVYVNILDLPNKQLTMQGRDDVRGEWIEDPTELIRLFFRFSQQPRYKYLGRVQCVGFAPWGTTANPARIFTLLD